MKYLTRLFKISKQLSKETDYNRMYFLYDYCLALLIHGCTLNQYLVGKFYKLKGFDRSRTVTYKRNVALCDLLNHPNYIQYLNNKVLFNKCFKEFIHRKWVFSKDNPETIANFLHEKQEFLLKPINLLQGKGIKKIIKNETFDEKEFIKDIRNKEYLLEEYIQQHPAMYLNNASVNTIRVFTLLDKNKQIQILKAILRAGVKDSIVDNFCQGGIIYPIDIKEGIIEDKGQNHKGLSFIYHPNSDICMLGFKIPNWSLLIETIKKIAITVPQCRFVGWDIAITQQGIELIEGNHYADHELLEFLGKEKMFYKKIKESI